MRVPIRHSNTEEWIIKLATSINAINDGQLSSNGSITLTENSATTVITDRRVGKDSVILFDPRTANAATELYGATMYISAVAPRSNTFTITHANNSQTDRTFKYIVLGQTLN